MIRRQTTDPGLLAFHQLMLLAFFFAMRSCEYLKLPKGSERRTKTLCVGNLVFRRQNQIVPHDDPDLEKADCVTITFEFQKRDLRDDAVTQSRTDDQLLCPVQAAAAIVRRLRSIGATTKDPIYLYRDKKGKLRDMTSSIALTLLRDFIKTVDASYGLPAMDIGLHSMRSSAAMAMYLNAIPVFTIMLLGRWSSDAFLRYIRKQVIEFSNDVARKMIKNSSYHHVPDASREDPRSHNPLAATANLGMGSSGATINRNVFSVWE
jgi:hypothetical protein